MTNKYVVGETPSSWFDITHPDLYEICGLHPEPLKVPKEGLEVEVEDAINVLKGTIEERFTLLEKSLDKLQLSFDKLQTSLDKIDAQLKKINRNLGEEDEEEVKKPRVDLFERLVELSRLKIEEEELKALKAKELKAEEEAGNSPLDSSDNKS